MSEPGRRGADAATVEPPERPLELRPERVRTARRKPYAVVDIGSNSVRLVVYEQLGRAPFPRFNEKSMCALGAGVDQTGELAASGFRRTVEATRRFKGIADAMGVTRIDVLATEAVRRATNGPDLVEAIRAESGLAVRVLSGVEEARYAALGVMSGFYRPSGLIGDMGGGSLEVAEILDDQVGERSASMPLGALPIQALLADPKRDAKREIDALLEAKLPPALTDPVFFAVGGGWRAFARVHMAAVQSPVQVAHGYAIPSDEARRFAKSLGKLSQAKIAALPGVPTRRVSTLPAAAILMDRVLKRLAPERVVFSALGLREGWLYAQLPVAERYLDPLVEGAQAFGTPQARVPAFGQALVRWTDELFASETANDRRLRLAACALSDIAWRDHVAVQAIESFERILQFPLVGLDHAERVFLATTLHARYASKPDDPRLRPAIDLISTSQRRRAQILGRALLLGYRVSGSVPEILGGARLKITNDAVRLEVGKAARVPDSEVVGDRLRLLAEAVGVRRTAIVEAE